VERKTVRHFKDGFTRAKPEPTASINIQEHFADNLFQILGQVNPILWDMRLSPYDERVAAFLRQRRGDQTYRQFAPKLGMSSSTLHRLENMEQSITLAKLHAVAQRMRVNIEDILSGRE
jgi:DNA-binding Xre family transcriptional regulator